MRGNRNNKEPRILNYFLLVGTVVTAVLIGFAFEFFYSFLSYRQLGSRVFMPIVLAILFACFLAVIVLVVYLISKLRLTYRADVITGRASNGRIFVYLLAGVALISLLLFGTEYLYENTFHINRQSPDDADTYVFLIDDSVSMHSNDPKRQRYEAIENILEDKPDTTQFTVYSFADTTSQIIPMQTTGDGFPKYPVIDAVMTEMKAGLEKVVDDCENGVWTADGSVMLVMITDGAPSDFDDFHEIRPVLDRCIQQNMTLRIVGIIGSNNTLMQQMADYTDGTFTHISDSGLVADAVLSVTGNSARTRDLLSSRNSVDMSWLYALIRIMSITAAGFIIAIIAALAYGNNTAFYFIISVNTVKAVIAAMVLEFGCQAVSDDRIVRLLVLILLGTIIAHDGSPAETVTRKYAEPHLYEASPGKNP